MLIFWCRLLMYTTPKTNLNGLHFQISVDISDVNLYTKPVSRVHKVWVS